MRNRFAFTKSYATVRNAVALAIGGQCDTDSTAPFVVYATGDRAP